MLVEYRGIVRGRLGSRLVRGEKEIGGRRRTYAAVSGAVV
jgi:hypothetical protein